MYNGNGMIPDNITDLDQQNLLVDSIHEEEEGTMPPDEQQRLSPPREYEDHQQVNELAPPGDLLNHKRVAPDSANHAGISASSQHKHMMMGLTPDNK